MAKGKGECEHPWYVSLGNGKYRCQKCKEVMVRTKEGLRPEEEAGGV